jgi:L-rhamnose isomerase/sugar isomerase
VQVRDTVNLEGALTPLDSFAIKIPSWEFSNTGTRFGKFLQAGAATTLEKKFADVAQVLALTGITPSLALHVLWDLPYGLDDVPEVKRLVQNYGVQAGAINPTLFQDQEYKFGSLCNPDAGKRRRVLRDPMRALAESGYIAKIERERASRNATLQSSYA